MFKMFDNIGNSIKWLAKIFYWIEVIAGIFVGSILVSIGVTALFSAYGGGESIFFGLLIIALSPIVAWILCAPVYGFGVIIDKLSEIAEYTGMDYAPEEMQKEYTNTKKQNHINEINIQKRLSQIEKLRSQGLISEEEYKQAISKLSKDN